MTMKKELFYVCALFLLMMGVSSCSSSDEEKKEDFEPKIISTNITSCKTDASRGTSVDNSQHYIVYEAQDGGVLYIKDVNQLVSCGASNFRMSATFVGNVITITEKFDDDMLANCLCPIDIEATIGSLKDGNYTLVLCLDDYEFARFDITYNSSLKGTFTVKEPEPPVAKNMMVDGINYKVLSEEEKTIEVTQLPDNGQYSGDVTIPEQVSYEGVTYRVVAVGDVAFYYCTEVTSVTLPKSITSIGTAAFFNCTRLESVNLPDQIVFIGTSAFSCCESLTRIDIPEGVTQIYSGIAATCANLTEVSLGSHLESIYSDAFKNCPQITKIYSKNPQAPTLVNPSPFDNVVEQNATLYVPRGSKEAYSTAKIWKDFAHIEEME